MDIIEKINNYNEDHCWQYDIRIKNYQTDLREESLTEEEVRKLKTSDFDFYCITDLDERKKMTKFIYKHEWLGNLSQFTTHWFGAYYNGVLSGVILMNMPNAFSKLLGDDTKHLERLVSRGACISWSPKNLASKFLMWCVKYMTQNTQYRLFTAYSDPTAKEIGTIYQACNWYYLGQKSGTTRRYINPYNGKLVTDRVFRARSFYKKYAKDLNIIWDKSWNNDQKILWENIPDDVELKLRQYSKYMQKNASYYIFPNKHKYAYILGENKKETNELRKIFLNRNKVQPYPKNRCECYNIKKYEIK